MSDGKVVFEVEGDTSKVEDSIKHVTDTIKRESKKWDSETSNSFKSVEDSASGTSRFLGAAFQGAFQSLTNTITDATKRILKAFADWAIASIDMASDLEEVQNVVDVTFGGSGAEKIDKWAKNAGAQFGLTELQAKKFTSTLGAMMKSSGLTGDEIVNMSTDMAGLAADMASFYNMDFETAFQKIRAGLSGETEPLKMLGINMSVDNLNEYLSSIGSDKKFGDMTQAEQFLTRYQFLLQSTADAQGDFARTAGDSYANMNRQIETQMATLQANVGKEALPLAKQFQTDWLNFLKLINGSEGVTVTGNETQLKTWIDQEAESAKNAREEFEALADQYGYIVDMDRETYESEPGFFGSYGEFILQQMRGQQMFSGGLQRERLDEAIPKMEEALARAEEAEAAVQDYQKQLDFLMESTEDTAENGAAVVNNFASGMDSAKGAIQAEVDDINNILSGIGTGSYFSAGFNLSLDGSHETGLDYVPFSGYLAELHEGEGILTAEENRIWQRFKNGQASTGNVDYETLGGMMRDNVRAGGDVYLDSRIVGRVMSAVQGAQYRSLERSGWQNGR